MKKLFFTISFIFFLLLFFGKKPVSAEDRCLDWSFTDEKGEDIVEKRWYKSIGKINYNFKIKDANQDPSATYNIILCTSINTCSNFLSLGDQTNNNKVAASNNTITGSITNYKSSSAPYDPVYNHIEVDLNGGGVNPICKYNIDWKDPPPSIGADCEMTLTPPKNIQPLKDDLKIDGKLTNIRGMKDYYINSTLSLSSPFLFISGTAIKNYINLDVANSSSGKAELFSTNLGKGWGVGSYTAIAKLWVSIADPFQLTAMEVNCSLSFKIPSGVIPTATPFPTPTTPSICNDKSARDDKICSGEYDNCPWCPGYKKRKLGIDIPPLKPLCDQLGGEFSGKCWECQKNGNKLWTAIGCIPINYTAFISDVIFKTGVGIAGGVAFLYFLFGAFMILTSSGNAEKMEEAKQIITSALAGLLLIIFSVFLLKTIGVDILKLPGFG